MVKAKRERNVSVQLVSRKIFFLREMHMMLDADLAALYRVTTSQLNRAVQRNRNRFPEDFMFQLNREEIDALRFHIGMSKRKGRGGRRYAPYAFTEQGVAMLSSVLRSERAVQVNIAIMRTFVRLREMLTSNEALRRKIEEMEKRYDTRFQIADCVCRHQGHAGSPAEAQTQHWLSRLAWFGLTVDSSDASDS
jgi:hypothetical protein